uniref:Uncharacterized protein n=1 Tax=Timema bartmani TaxID=61472 RepID=A0A7R9FDK8_9NEOP|nr:unnamed protein product [Timema bartmani]
MNTQFACFQPSQYFKVKPRMVDKSNNFYILISQSVVLVLKKFYSQLHSPYHVTVPTNEMVRDFVQSKTLEENRLQQGASIKQSADQ